MNTKLNLSNILNNFLLTEEWINALTQMDVKCEIK